LIAIGRRAHERVSSGLQNIATSLVKLVEYLGDLHRFN
jgi:hypothetical protein